MFHAEMFLAMTMLQAVKLRLRPRSWLQHQDPLDMEAQAALLEKAEGPCRHEKIQRSGNKHGRYAKGVDVDSDQGSLLEIRLLRVDQQLNICFGFITQLR